MRDEEESTTPSEGNKTTLRSTIDELVEDQIRSWKAGAAEASGKAIGALFEEDISEAAELFQKAARLTLMISEANRWLRIFSREIEKAGTDG